MSTKKDAPKLTPCNCGCGELCERRYVRGHDSKHKSKLLAVIYDHSPDRKPSEVANARAEMEELGWTGRINAKKAEYADRARKGQTAADRPMKKRPEPVAEDEGEDITQID